MRRRALIALVPAAAVVIAVVVARAATGSHKPNGDSATTGAPVRTVSGHGRSNQAVDLDGARRAGIVAVASTGKVVSAGFISRREIVQKFTTPEFGPRLADETSAQLTTLLEELGQREADPAKLAVLEQPITATATPTMTGARVQVWSVLVVAVPGSGPARAMWRTVALKVVHVGARWLVDGWDSRPGPTPALPLEGRVEPADEVAQHLRWPAAASNTLGGR